MKVKFTQLVLLLFLIFFSEASYSQQGGYFHLGLASPVSDFGKIESFNRYARGAAIGVNIGGRYVYPTKIEGLGVFVSADIIYNGLKSDYKDFFRDIDAPGVNLDKTHKFINIATLVGGNLNYEVDDNFKLFGNLGIGPDLLKVTDLKISYFESDDEYGEVRIHFKPSTKIGFGFSGGVLYKDKYTFELNYSALGKHYNNRYEKISAHEYGSTTSTSEQVNDLISKIKLFSIKVGIKI